ncbi:AMP-binding protein [Nonlabens tegetincola]|uniref:AMP-binding protein n=1 Tax=Nonlabens tegetincola TaxID=323273 RepID=UPI0021574129|nr:AMP-binding protein [Nonlabens tegetincola]
MKKKEQMIPKVHPSFKLNGRSLDHEGLMIVAYSYVKEGDAWEKEVGDFLLNWLDDFEVLTVNTSGSTGQPKSLKINKQFFLNSAAITANYFDLIPGKQVLCCLPLQYIAGKMMFIRAIQHGWHLDCVEPTSQPLKKAEKRYDFTAMTPFQLSQSLDNIHKSRVTLLGGSPVTATLVGQLQGKHSRVYQSYGMTETCSHVAIRQLYPHYEACYTAVGKTTFSLSKDQTLVIDAPQVSPDLLTTNDLVLLHNEQKFELLGRLDDVINSGGVKLHPLKIEDKLSSQISNRFFIGSLPDNDLGEQVVLIVESESPFDIDFNGLDKFEVPRAIYFLPTLVETNTGKIQKKKSIEQALLHAS